MFEMAVRRIPGPGFWYPTWVARSTKYPQFPPRYGYTQRQAVLSLVVSLIVHMALGMYLPERKGR
ncbi:hypothetical protein SEA_TROGGLEHUMPER_73 [Rhodococcus phage Trogglehumper]|uniref:Uncharacterized protein n=1 Tax=Rhodococcus phage Trogglehumper TaxID=3038381 RepID=A0AAF0GIM2_9CAUD|nr:hypothetical protein SEA_TROGGLEHUMPER_73 [Rhodococcus phage Trogglehumper]